MIDWTHWHNEPYLVGGLILLGWAYAILTGPLRINLAPGETRDRARTVAFYGALMTFYLAVGSPLDQIGERFLLSAHMIQHQLLVYVAAPLFLVGLPPWLSDRLLTVTGLGGPLRLLLHPVACALLYSLVLSLWHIPSFYDWALRDKVVHVIEHLMFFGAALFYWWPVAGTATRRPRMAAPLQLLYLGAVTILMTPVFAFIAFSDSVLYPTYEYAPRIIAKLGAQEDQLLGAGIMKLGGLFVMVVVAGVAFYRWAQRDRGPDPSVS